MTAREYKLDMTMTLTVHDAFRRELDRITEVAAGEGGDPRRILCSTPGWRIFRRFLRIHNAAEEAAVWGLLHDRLTAPSDRALLAALEAGHAAQDRLLAAVDGALADEVTGAERLGGLVGDLAAGLRAHLENEEAGGLALADAHLSEEEWTRFSALQLRKVGEHLGTWLPWILDGVTPDWAETVLSRLPSYGRVVYEGTWRGAYECMSLWTPEEDPGCRPDPEPEYIEF
jgi:hypothetical protein